MPTDHSRRALLIASLVSASLLPLRPVLAMAGRASPVVAGLSALEGKHGGRLGVSILDTGSGRRINHRGEERFAMCSTFKLLAAGLVLVRVDRGEERLERRVVFAKQDLAPYSPVTEQHVGGIGMTVAGLCHATITLSDNTAANLLLASFGGPSALTGFVRTLGDGVTRLDRIEPDLNSAIPGDLRDTTTPAAMLGDMRALLLGDTLSLKSRIQLADWLVATRTGDKRLRAGMPANWRIGDKTGTSGNGLCNDIAIAWPLNRKPLLVTAYYDAPKATDDVRNAVLADVGRIVVGLR